MRRMTRAIGEMIHLPPEYLSNSYCTLDGILSKGYIMSVSMPREVLFTFRQERGIELASTRSIRREGDMWIVPSQEGAGFYEVELKGPSGEESTCTCADYRKHGCTC